MGRRAHEREHLRERGRLAVAYSTAELTNIHRAGRQHGRVLPRLPFLVLSEIDGRWIVYDKVLDHDALPFEANGVIVRR